jgi:hypothetical protein
MAALDLSIINAALTATGNDPISGLPPEDDSIGAVIAGQNYEEMARGELANHPWKRATKIQELNRLDPDVHGDPPEPWTAAYLLPTDLLEIRTVKVAGEPIDYRIHGNSILCDAGETDHVILHYVYRPPEIDWPPWFRLGMKYRCEAMFLRGIGERYPEAKSRDTAADDQFAMARNRDSTAEPPKDPTISPTLQARTGAVQPLSFRR